MGIRWMNKKAAASTEKPEQQQTHAEKPHEENWNGPFIVHNSDPKMRCLFNSVVVRNESLNAKYPGGLDGFIRKNGGVANWDITVTFSMAEDIYEVVDDLRHQGLSGGDDFVFVDAAGYSIQTFRDKKDFPHNIDVGVGWLKARYADGGIWVWIAE